MAAKGSLESRAELEQIQMQMNTVTNESLESTRRMLNLCEESKDAGIRTLVMLDEQGEQLDRIEEGMTQIKEDMKAAEKNLEEMEKCCGLCVLPWNRSKNFERSGNSAWKKNEDGKVNTSGPRVVVADGKMAPQGGFITKITNDAREDEMEQNMQEISSMLGNLKNMAVDMSNEIGSQNIQIEKITEQAIANEGRITDADKKTHKLLND